jgi:hypothetical protein
MTSDPEQPPVAPLARPVLTGPPLIVRRAVFIIVLALVALSVLVTIALDFRLGGYVLAAALLFGAVARAVLPEYLCLGLLVRSRRQDVITLLILGVAMSVSASVVPGG